MIAWSLSGGGNRGPIQVGAMRALFEAGIAPQMLVGTSAGALNAAFLASDPTREGNELLARRWLATTQRDIFPKHRVRQILRLVLGGNALNDDSAVRRFFVKNMPPGIERFGDLKVKLYLTTADIQTGRLFLYGDDPKARILDAALCSTALPLVWDPQLIGGHQFVDGAIVANVPITVAAQRGATVIYALDLQNPGPYPLHKGALNIVLHSISVQTLQQVFDDIEKTLAAHTVTLHYINLGDIFGNLPLEDFSHTADMIEQGYARTKAYLANPTPNRAPHAPRPRGDMVVPPGAVVFEPREIRH